MIFGHSIQVGLSFGLTSGVLTALGLVVGLASGTDSRLAVVGGIVTIAVADSLSDSLGIHISEELESVHTPREIWVSTAVTFGSKLAVTLSFLIPLMFFSLRVGVILSVVWSVAMLTMLSFYAAHRLKVRAWPVVAEHLGVATVVVGVTHLLGGWVRALAG